MSKKYYKIFSAVALALTIIIIAPSAAVAQYRVSGLVEFSYRDYEVKTGDSKTSDVYWTQTYRANLSGPFLDPRFLLFNAGVGYNVIEYKGGADSTALDYALSSSFFPGRIVAWDLYGFKNTTDYNSPTNIVGYDVTTTTYGGVLYLNLGRKGTANFNNRGSSPDLPNFVFSYARLESDSQAALNPLQETRDNVTGSASYQVGNKLNLQLDAGLEKYENKINSSSYDTTTANLLSTARLGSDATLNVNGHFYDRQTDNFVGFETFAKVWSFDMLLNFRERDRWHHYYRYEYAGQKSQTNDLWRQKAEARVLYRVLPSLQVEGGADYYYSEYSAEAAITPTGTSPETKSSLTSGGLLTGLLYNYTYKPAFLGPFAFNTGYEFQFGLSKYTDNIGGPEGKGLYNSNNVTLGFTSSGWRNESLGLTYNYYSRNDNSPAENDSWLHSYRFNVGTRRIPRTNLYGYVSYISQSNRSAANTLLNPVGTFVGAQNQSQDNRSFIYSASLDYLISSYFSFTATASRDRSRSQYYTLSTLSSTAAFLENLYTATLNFAYPLTRSLIYRAAWYEEYRDSASVDRFTHEARMFLDYRLRQVFISLEYRWREVDPDVGQSIIQQYYYAKLSRPF